MHTYCTSNQESGASHLPDLGKFPNLNGGLPANASLTFVPPASALEKQTPNEYFHLLPPALDNQVRPWLVATYKLETYQPKARLRRICKDGIGKTDKVALKNGDSA